MITHTLNEIAYSIWNTVRPHITDDDPIDIRSIKDYIHTYRAKYIKQNLEKHSHYIDPSIIQNLQSVEMEFTDSSENSTYTTEYNMLRTTEEIPHVISLYTNESMFTRIAPADRLSSNFCFTTHEMAINGGNLRFNDHQIFAFLLDNRIYLYSKSNESWKGIKYINIQGIFQNPVDVWRFTDPTTYHTFDETINYPLNKTMRSDIEKEILKDKFNIILQAPIDDTNDGTHSLNSQEDERK